MISLFDLKSFCFSSCFTSFILFSITCNCFFTCVSCSCCCYYLLLWNNVGVHIHYNITIKRLCHKCLFGNTTHSNTSYVLKTLHIVLRMFWQKGLLFSINIQMLCKKSKKTIFNKQTYFKIHCLFIIAYFQLCCLPLQYGQKAKTHKWLIIILQNNFR